MTSERQKAANRANALHSTGPKTPEGKAGVRLNALRHGLLTRDLVLPGEDADAFEDLWNQVRASFSPVGPIEEFLVERVVNALWRLRRLARAETALFHWRVHAFKADRLTKQVGSYEKIFLDGLSLPGPFSAPEITDKPRMQKRRRRSGRQDTSGTGTRFSLDGRSTPTPRRGTLSASLFATRGVSSGRSFAPSTSFAKYGATAKIVRHSRFRMLLRRTQTIPNDKLLQMEAYRRTAAESTSRPGVFQWMKSNVWYPGLTPAMILSGSAVHTKGLG
jgi:hypothetical protein